nr:hypothetical protein [Methanosarcina horonobensis]
MTPREVGSLVEEFFANIVPYESENKETEIKKTGKKEPESPASRRPEFGSLAEKL